MNPIESLLIDGCLDLPESFVIPAMSLSSARAELVRHSCVVDMDTMLVAELLGPLYGDWVEESKRDDAICGGPQDDLGAAGYPSLETVLRTPDLAKLVIGDYLLDALARFTWDGMVPAKYWLDRFTDCRIAGRHIRLYGICYGKPSASVQK